MTNGARKPLASKSRLSSSVSHTSPCSASNSARPFGAALSSLTNWRRAFSVVSLSMASVLPDAHYSDDRLRVVARPTQGGKPTERRISLAVVVPDVHREIAPLASGRLSGEGVPGRDILVHPGDGDSEQVEDVPKSASLILPGHALRHRHALGPYARRHRDREPETGLLGELGHVHQHAIRNRLGSRVGMNDLPVVHCSPPSLAAALLCVSARRLSHSSASSATRATCTRSARAYVFA